MTPPGPMAIAATAVGASETFSTPAAGSAIGRTSPARTADSWKPPSVCARLAACAAPGNLGPCAAMAFFPPMAVIATSTRTRAPLPPSTFPNRCPDASSSAKPRAFFDSTMSRRNPCPRFHTGPTPRYAISDAVSPIAMNFVMGSGATSMTSDVPMMDTTIARSASGLARSFTTSSTPSQTVSSAKESAIMRRSIGPRLNSPANRLRHAVGAPCRWQYRAEEPVTFQPCAPSTLAAAPPGGDKQRARLPPRGLVAHDFQIHVEHEPRDGALELPFVDLDLLGIDGLVDNGCPLPGIQIHDPRRRARRRQQPQHRESAQPHVPPLLPPPPTPQKN